MVVGHSPGAVILGLNRIANRPRVVTPVLVLDLPAGVCVTLPTKSRGSTISLKL